MDGKKKEANFNWVQAATDMHPLAPTRNKIIHKTACSDRSNSGSRKSSQNRLGLPSCPSGLHKPQSFIESKPLLFLQPRFKKIFTVPKIKSGRRDLMGSQRVARASLERGMEAASGKKRTPQHKGKEGRKR